MAYRYLTHRHLEPSQYAKAALIIRKYALGDKAFYFQKFEGLSKYMLEQGWDYALSKIQNQEIIKDSHSATEMESTTSLSDEITIFGKDLNRIYFFLTSPFDAKKLHLHEENKERHLRHLLAEIYLNETLKQLDSNERFMKRTSIIRKGVSFAKDHAGKLFLVFIIGLFTLPRIIEGFSTPQHLLEKYLKDNYPEAGSDLTNVNKLEYYLRENSRRKFNGAICNDGWTSHSQGPGTCSHHHGVSFYFYIGDYSMSNEVCHKEAVQIITELKARAAQKSWID
jgi:hypothetical protein